MCFAANSTANVCFVHHFNKNCTKQNFFSNENKGKKAIVLCDKQMQEQMSYQSDMCSHIFRLITKYLKLLSSTSLGFCPQNQSLHSALRTHCTHMFILPCMVSFVARGTPPCNNFSMQKPSACP